MVKKKSAPSKPVVSNLPLPISETPLVIDLPDGQKLVIGKLAHGSVIEVATWRGTGRPDSRTNRLMLGMSSAADAVTASNSETAPSKKLISKDGIDLKAIFSKFSKIDLSVFARSAANIKDRFAKKVETAKIQEPKEYTTDVEIDEWLAKIANKAVAKLEREKVSESKAKTTPKVTRKTSPVSKKKS